MFHYPARSQRRPEPRYRELEALADDLEYRASLARQAARRQSAATSSLARGPRYAPREGTYRPHSAYEYDPRYGSRAVYQPTPYQRPEPRHYYGEESEPPQYFYEPEPVYDRAVYDYEQPVIRRPHPIYHEDDVEYVPNTLAPLRRRAIPPVQLPRFSRSIQRHPSYAFDDDEEMPPLEYMQVQTTQQRKNLRRASAHNLRSSSEGVNGRRRQPDQSSERESIQLQDILSLVQGVVAKAAAPAEPTTPPAPAPARLPPTPHGTSAETLLQRLFGGQVADLNSRRRTTHPPAPKMSNTPVKPDVESVLRQLFGGDAELQSTSAGPPSEGEASPSLEDFLGQILSLAGGQEHQKQQSAPAAQEQKKPASRMGAQLEKGVHFAFNVPSSQDSSAQSQPVTSKPIGSKASAAAAVPAKVAYTYANPASVQRAAIPSKPSTTVKSTTSPSPSLPVPGRTFQHLTPNPNDVNAGVQVQAKTGAADEVADIKEAIRRSLDRREDVVKLTVPSGTSGPTPATPAVPVQEPIARTPSPTPSTNSVSSVAMSSIDHIEERFVNLTYDFSFPSTPDFDLSSSSSASTAAQALSFTHVNQPIRAYEHALTSLLTDLDAVESAGDEDVRHARKELVKRIERELEKLDGLKEEAWRRASAASSAPTSPETGADVKETNAVTRPELEDIHVSTAQDMVAEHSVSEPEGYVINAESAAEVDVGQVVEAPVEENEVGLVSGAPVLSAAELEPDVLEVETTPAADADQSTTSADVVSSEEPTLARIEDIQSSELEDSAFTNEPSETDSVTSSSSYSHRRASEPITSSYPPTASYRPAPNRRSSYPPSPSLGVDSHEPAMVEADEGQTIDSLGSSPVEIPSELDSESGDEDAASRAEDLQKSEEHEYDEENEVPPSMEESQLLEEKTEFILL